MRQVRLIDPRDRILRTAVPETRRERMRGLLGHSKMATDEALFLERTRSVHTFGMRIPITVVLLDRDLLVRGVLPLRPRRLLLPRPGIRHVLECVEGTDLGPGDQLRIAPSG
ncbi:MAG: DUF192 domain-containing protein [Actinomycetota bacterium]